MVKILYYEIKRLLFTKVYAALLFITLVFSYYVLRNFTILGTADTAPFSKWSYSGFLCSVSPFLIVSMLFFCTYVFSKKELSIRTITLATPKPIFQYYLTKSAAIMLSFIITAVLIISLSFIFYAQVYKFYDYKTFLEPIFLFLVPPAIFLFGLGMLAGMINSNLQYILIVLVFVIGNLGISLLGYAELFSKTFVQTYSLGLAANAAGEVPFSLPSGFIISRFIWSILGIFMFSMVCILSNIKSERNR